MSAAIDNGVALELERLERLLLDPDFRRDAARVSALLSDDFFEFGSSGRVWTRAATLELLATEIYTPPEVEDLACRVLAPGVIHVTYRAIRRNETPQPAVTLRSSIWTNHTGTWQMRFHQGTKAF